MNGQRMTSGHRLLSLFVKRGQRRFVRQLDQLEKVQRQKLRRLVKQVARAGSDSPVSGVTSWEDFSRTVPQSTYEDWREAVLAQRRDKVARLTSSPVVRYQPTSGSSASVKWIPYTGAFLKELDAAICPWVADLYGQWPGIGCGRHYWSMSWVPTALREQMSHDVNDDMKVMSLGKRLLAGITQAVPQDVALARTSDASLFASVAYLVADEQLAMMSIWSPTFGLALLEAIADWRDELAEVLRKGHWGSRAESVGNLPAPRSLAAAGKLEQWNGEADAEFFMRLWPRLSLVSAWDTAASAPWAEKLQALLPHAGFQGKGLWATEGVLTIPWRGQFPLAYQSHVYEFRDLNDGRIVAPWELRQGQDVTPLLSTGSGLLRYAMNDMLRVEGFVGSVPSLRFLGRNDGTDLVGEKLSVALVQSILDDLDYRGVIRPLSLVARDNAREGKPGYCLLAEPAGRDNETDLAAQLRATSQALEHRLLRHFHYRLARDLGQLAPVQTLCHHRMRDHYLQQCRRQGMMEGNIKVEVLRHWGRQLTLEMPDVQRASADEALRAGA